MAIVIPICVIALIIVLTVALFVWFKLKQPQDRRASDNSAEPIVSHMGNGYHKNIYTPPVSVSKDRGEILLVSFVDSEEFSDLSSRLGDWLASMGCKVHDLSSLSEEVMANPEAWLHDTISKERTRVVLINSPLAVAAAMGTGTESSQPLTDSCYDLRVAALRRVQSQLLSKYGRLCVVTFSALRPRKNTLVDLTPGVDWVLPKSLESVRGWVVGSHVIHAQNGHSVGAETATNESESRFVEAMRRFQDYQRLSPSVV